MIWPFKEKHTAEYKVPELSTIKFRLSDGMYSYTPMADITPHEAALLIPLFINPMWRANYEGWVNKYNLKRHFTKIEE